MLATMKKIITYLAICCTCCLYQAQGQTLGSPYKISTSGEFKIPKRQHDLATIDYGPLGILQVYNRGIRSFGFWMFDSNFKLKSQQEVETKELFDGHVNYNAFVSLRTKSYLFVREVFRESATEGITALQFMPGTLSFKGQPVNLFRSTDRVIDGDQESLVSEDRTKIMFYYTLRREDRNEKVNQNVMGFHVYDENLNKLWGGEYQMPYTEAIMSPVGQMLSDDGRLMLLAKIYDHDDHRERSDGRPNYHYEVLIYSGASKKPAIMRIEFDNYYVNQSLIYEDMAHRVVVTGFYSNGPGNYTEGAYMVKLPGTPDAMVTAKPYYYEIPTQVIKYYTSDRDQRKIDRNESRGRAIGIPNLKFRKTFFMSDSSTVVIAEQYQVVVSTYYNGRTTTYTYDTYADDIYILKFDALGKVIWINKIAKAQHSNDAYGRTLSFNAVPNKGGVDLFFIDNLKNLNLPINESPYMHQEGRGGYFTGVSVDSEGYMKRYSLGEMDAFETDFCIRYFDAGNHGNLLGSGRSGRRGFMYSIETK